MKLLRKPLPRAYIWIHPASTKPSDHLSCMQDLFYSLSLFLIFPPSRVFHTAVDLDLYQTSTLHACVILSIDFWVIKRLIIFQSVQPVNEH